MDELAGFARSLAAVRTEDASAVSLYADLDPEVVPNDRALESHVTSLLDEAQRSVENLPDAGHESKVRLRESLGRIRHFLEDELDRTGAHGVALFAADGEDVWQEARLPARVDDHVSIGRSFSLAPLVPFLERDRDVVVVLVGRDRGSIWRVRNGRPLEHVEVSRDGQGQHDQGGWSQARYARSRDKEALDHMREVAALASAQVPAGSSTVLAIACLEEYRTTFAELLEPHARAAVVGWLEYDVHADLPELMPHVERVVEAHLRTERKALLERWREERGQVSGFATDTWELTLAAAADGAIAAALLGGGTRPAFECPACGRAYAQPGACPLDSTPLVTPPVSALEVVVRGTLLHGGEARMLDELAEAEVGAVLRYPQPPTEPVTPALG
jgi:peptide chain release factor subunit 1